MDVVACRTAAPRCARLSGLNTRSMFAQVKLDPDDDLIASIAPNVLRCLDRVKFFEKMDDLLCAADALARRERCSRDYRISRRILNELKFGLSDQEDIFEVLRCKGGFCDCEILYNVPETSRLKAEYWRGRLSGNVIAARHVDS